MKPSEMSNEELAKVLRDMPIDRRELPTKDDWFSALDAIDEAAARLRNSIPKPVVEVRKTELIWDDYEVVANGCQVYCGPGSVRAKNYAKLLRTALGINDTEGGV